MRVLTTALAVLAVFVLSTAHPEGAGAEPVEYKLAPTHSYVLFNVDHLRVSTAWGRFNELSGSFTYDQENPRNSSVSITVQADSIDTANKRRDKHLRGPDFFNVKQFPEITFESTEVSSTGERSLQITGDLTLHGQTREITTTARYGGKTKSPDGNTVAGWDARFTIQRSDFGMDYLVGGIGDEVEVIVSLEGKRQE